MSFIGNDIMFFENNVNTFSRKGAVNHILSENEFTDESLNHFPIIAWTIKESIYKIICKDGYRKAFAPRNISILKFEKKDSSNFSGEAIFQNRKYFFHSQITDKLIYTYAGDNFNNLSEIKHHFFYNVSDISNKEFNNFLEIRGWEINHTNEGIPYVINKQNIIDISITHDNNVIVLSEYTYFIKE